MNKYNPEEFANDIKNMMKEYGLPYIDIKIYNESANDNSKDSSKLKSPLKNVSLKIEALVNALLGDMMFAGMEEAGFLINQLENQIGDLLTLSAYLRLKHDKNKITNVIKDKIENVMKQRKAESIPIPKAFSEALKEILKDDNIDG